MWQQLIRSAQANLEVEFNFSYFFGVLTDSMPCTSPKGFPPCPCVLVGTLSSRQHHMALAVLHYWCFPVPQSMYAQQNCAGVASCLAKATSRNQKKHGFKGALFQSRQIWVSEVAHMGERSSMELPKVCCWVFSQVPRSCLEVVQQQQRFFLCEALDP